MTLNFRFCAYSSSGPVEGSEAGFFAGGTRSLLMIADDAVGLSSAGHSILMET